MAESAQDRETDLTGVWHGLYSYQEWDAPVAFVATLLETERRLSGTTHEPRTVGTPVGETIYATLDGGRQDFAVAFIKTYDPAAGGGYGTVAYEGTLSGDGTEIEGRWTIHNRLSGKFLMIRSSGKAAARPRKASARV